MKKLLAWLIILFCAYTGVMAAANGEASCMHNNIVYGPGETDVSSMDRDYHVWFTRIPVICADCGEYLYDEYTDYIDEEHCFDSSGLCTVCGCVKNCRHPNAFVDYAIQMPSTVVNPEIHALETHIRYECPDCGELYWEIKPGSAVYGSHEFDEDGICTICWYNKNTGAFSSSQTDLDPVSSKGAVTVGDKIITPIKLNIRLLSDADGRHYSCSGPGKQYESTGGFKPMKVWSTYAWFIEGDYVLTDVSYQTVKRCTVYLKKSAFTSVDGVPEIDLNQLAQPAAVTEKTVPSMFPRNNRRMFDEKTVSLSAGTPVTVFFEKDGWYYCEFTSKSNNPARGWIQKDLVSLTNGQ